MPGYYDLEAANERVRELRPLLSELRADRDAIAASQSRLTQPGTEDGAKEPEGSARLQHERDRLTDIVRRMQRTVRQIDAWGVTLRDIGTGLVDFPALVSGRPIWLCWKLGEESIRSSIGRTLHAVARTHTHDRVVWVGAPDKAADHVALLTLLHRCARSLLGFARSSAPSACGAPIRPKPVHRPPGGRHAVEHIGQSPSLPRSLTLL